METMIIKNQGDICVICNSLDQNTTIQWNNIIVSGNDPWDAFSKWLWYFNSNTKTKIIVAEMIVEIAKELQKSKEN